MPTQPDVRPGQIWADNDPRSAGRTLKVVAVGTRLARCVVLTTSEGGPASTVGKTRMIAIERFRPVSNGYRLVEDA